MKIFRIISKLSDWQSFANADTNNSLQSKSVEKNRKQVWKYFKNNIISDSNKYDIFISILTILLCIFPFINELKHFWNWNVPHYVNSISAWLMTYDGGFIRRGLAGEIVQFIIDSTSLYPHEVIFIIALIFYFILFLWVIFILGKTYPIYFILSPVFFALISRYGTIFSMDYILLISFLYSLKIIFSNNKIHIKIIIINVVSIITILMHEVYFFSFLPQLFVLYNLSVYKKIFSTKSLIVFAIPVIVMVLVLLNAHHTIETTKIIMEYWNDIYRQKLPEFCCIDYPPYFWFYIHTWYEQQFPQILKIFRAVSFGIFWNPIVWVMFWYYCGLITAKVIYHYDPGKEKIYLTFYYFSTFCSIPLYFIAWDYGRWILFSSISSILITYSIPSNINFPNITKKIKLKTWKAPLKIWQKITIVTIIGIPTHWYNRTLGELIYPSPMWYPLHFFIDFSSWPFN